MKRKFLLSLLIAASSCANLFGANAGLGIYRNGTGTAIDTVHFYGTTGDSLWLKPTAADSIMYHRYYQGVVFESSFVAWATDNIDYGSYHRAFLARRNAADTGHYAIRAIPYNNGNRSTYTYGDATWLYYEARSDPKGDTVSLFAGAVNQTSTEPDYMQRSDSSVIRGNIVDEKVDVNAGGAVTLVATTTTVTNPVTVGTNNDKTGYTLSAAGIQALRDSILSTWFDNAENLIRNPGFENGTGDLPQPGWRERIAGNNIKISTALPNSGRKALRFFGTTNGVDCDSIYLSANSNIVLGGRVFASATGNAEIGLYPVGGAIAAAKAVAQKVDDYHSVVASKRIVSTGFYTVLLAGGSGASDTVHWDDVYLKVFPDTLDTAAIARAPWDNDLIAQVGRIVDSTAKGPREVDIQTWKDVAPNALVSGRVDASIGNVPDGTLDSADFSDAFFRAVARFAADSVWRANFAHILSGSSGAMIIDSAKGWGQTAAAGAAPDSATISRIVRRILGGGNVSLNGSDSLTTAQKVVTAALQSLGVGPYTATVYFLDSATSVAVQGWNVSYRDSATGSQYTQAMQSDANGKVQANVIGSTTYFVRGSRQFSRFATNADTTLNVAAANFTDTVSVVTSQLASLGVTGTVTVYGYEVGPDGVGIAGAKVTARLSTTSTGGLIQFAGTDSAKWMNNIPKITFTSANPDSLGLWRLPLIPPISLQDTCANYTITVEGNAGGQQIRKTYRCVRPPNCIGQVWIVREEDPCPSCE